MDVPSFVPLDAVWLRSSVTRNDGQGYRRLNAAEADAAARRRRSGGGGGGGGRVVDGDDVELGLEPFDGGEDG
jgi:hypothetical protein